MASTIPESMVFSMLRKLPSNSFVTKWRRIRPNMQIPYGGKVLVGTGGSKYDVSLNINGAVNEMALMSQARIAISMSSTSVLTSTAATTFPNPALSPINKQSPFNHTSWKYAGGNIFSSTRETFNAGSLCLYENSNSESLSAVNVLRGLCARRSARFDSSEISSNYDDVKVNSLCINDLENAGFSGYQARMDGIGYTKAGTGAFTIGEYDKATNGFGGGVTYPNASVGFPRDTNKFWEFPLGQFSSLASTYSVIPIGMMSSMSINGWSIDLQFDGTNSTVNPTFDPNTPSPASVALTQSGDTIRLHQVEIYIPTITILNPEVMNGLFSLYRKEASVQVGNVSVPMSLRLNTLNFRTSTYSIAAGLNQYHIPSTEKSARALFWIVYDKDSKSKSTLIDNIETDRTQETSSVLEYPLCIKGCSLKSLEIKIGSTDLVPCIKNDTPNDGHVEAFIFANLKAAGACASLFPYWDELTKHDVGYAEDVLYPLRTRALSGAVPPASNIVNVNSYRSRNNATVQYGCVSFQNMDYRSSDSGTTASGVSLNNIGRYDVSMEFASIDQHLRGDLDQYEPPINIANKRIVFFEVYDEVIEVSASNGVQLITNAVLA